MDAAPRRQHPDKHPTQYAASPPSTSRKIYTNITPPWWQRPFGPDILELSSNTFCRPDQTILGKLWIERMDDVPCFPAVPLVPVRLKAATKPAPAGGPCRSSSTPKPPAKRVSASGGRSLPCRVEPMPPLRRVCVLRGFLLISKSKAEQARPNLCLHCFYRNFKIRRIAAGMEPA